MITSSDHFRLTREACSGGARIIQYRDKDSDHETLLENALAIRAVTRKNGCLFIVNDNIEVAIDSEADGVHLGQDDSSIKQAREIAPPGFIVGISTHSMAQALDAERSGADYVGFGPVFSTPVKDSYKPVGIEKLKNVAASVSIPVVAIGGITPENAPPLAASGASCIAMIRGFYKDTASTVKYINSLFALKPQ